MINKLHVLHKNRLHQLDFQPTHTTFNKLQYRNPTAYKTLNQLTRLLPNLHPAPGVHNPDPVDHNSTHAGYNGAPVVCNSAHVDHHPTHVDYNAAPSSVRRRGVSELAAHVVHNPAPVIHNPSSVVHNPATVDHNSTHVDYNVAHAVYNPTHVDRNPNHVDYNAAPRSIIKPVATIFAAPAWCLRAGSLEVITNPSILVHRRGV